MKHRDLYTKLVQVISLILMALFIYTAVSKLLYLDTFQMRLGQMPYLSKNALPISWAIPFLELVIAGLMLLPRYRTIGFYASVGLLGLFTLYIVVLLHSGTDLPCSCGGILSTMGWKDHILFNGVCMAMALLAIIIDKKQNRETLPHHNTT